MKLFYRERLANSSSARPCLEPLEPRLVLSASVDLGRIAPPDVLPTPAIEAIHLTSVRDLGDLPPAASTTPIKATAWIPSGGSVTFRFEATFAADYTLLFRYSGDRVALNARTPGGTAAIPHGPAGPFSAVPLSLSTGEYFVTAIADGDGPVLVDWDLVLSNGVGQATSLNLQVLDATTAIEAPAIAANPSPSSTLAAISSATSSVPSDAPAMTPYAQGAPLTLDLGGTLSGRPELETQRVAAVGPGERGRTVSLAALGDELLPGIDYGRSSQDRGDEAIAQPADGALVRTSRDDHSSAGPNFPKSSDGWIGWP